MSFKMRRTMSQPIFTPEIMPCAICGSSARLIDWDFRGRWRVICDYGSHGMRGENNTKNRAVHKWNNRQKKILADKLDGDDKVAKVDEEVK